MTTKSGAGCLILFETVPKGLTDLPFGIRFLSYLVQLLSSEPVAFYRRYSEREILPLGPLAATRYATMSRSPGLNARGQGHLTLDGGELQGAFGPWSHFPGLTLVYRRDHSRRPQTTHPPLKDPLGQDRTERTSLQLQWNSPLCNQVIPAETT